MKIFKYVVSIFLMFGGIGLFFQSHFIGGLLILILGLIILPPVSNSLKVRYTFFKKAQIRYAIYIVLFFTGGYHIEKPYESGKSTNVIVHKEKGREKQVLTRKDSIRLIMGNDDFWKLYDPELKSRIYNLIKSKDCDGLQREFNIADRNSKVNLKRTGTSNAYLMDFINSKMKRLGCY